MRKSEVYLSNFVDLLKAGLWEKDIWLSKTDDSGFENIFRLAEEQSVVGVVAAGIEHLQDTKVIKKDTLSFVRTAIQLEQRNKAMNSFIVVLQKLLKDAGIFFLLVKGQGVAQCYDRPYWRASGDIDLLLDFKNYNKAKKLLIPIASSTEEEDKDEIHLALTISSWVVELHGSMRSLRLPRMDKIIDEVQRDSLENGKARIWNNAGAEILLPSPDNDVILIFTHILKHFYKEGVGLRQICDWCRLLWSYKDSIDHELLGMRLNRMGVESEWKAFAVLAVNYLGMPEDAMPFYSRDDRWYRKARRIINIIIEKGSFGHNKDTSYKYKYPLLVRKTISFGRQSSSSIKLFFIFPLNSIVSWGNMLSYGFRKKFIE